MARKALPPAPPGYEWIFRPWKTDPKTGERIYARAFGKRAWMMLVPVV